jgi:hypothetical protein
MGNRAKQVFDRLKCTAAVEAVLQNGEDLNEFYALCDQTFLEYRPCGPSEEICALSIAKSLWHKLHLHAREGDELPEPDLDPLHKSIVAWRLGCDPSTVSKEIVAKIDQEVRDQHKEKKQKEGLKRDAESLRRQGEFDAGLDAQINHALKQMVQLKSMKRRAGLAR